jgi:hypothetical protein
MKFLRKESHLHSRCTEGSQASKAMLHKEFKPQRLCYTRKSSLKGYASQGSQSSKPMLHKEVKPQRLDFLSNKRKSTFKGLTSFAIKGSQPSKA